MSYELKETPFFFANGRVQLFGIRHDPIGVQPKSAFVVCHAFGEEKLWSHRVFVDFARRAALDGNTVLRFDFMGHGDSDGHSEDCSLETYLSDIESAVRTMRGDLAAQTPISLVGLRFGATLAALYAENSNEISNLVLWQPIVRGATYMQELLRINLVTQMTAFGEISQNRKQLVDHLYSGNLVNVDGYLISGEFHRQCHELSLLASPRSESAANCLVVQCLSRKGSGTNSEFLELADRYPTSSAQVVNTPPFWREIRPFCQKLPSLVDATLRWTSGEVDG